MWKQSHALREGGRREEVIGHGVSLDAMGGTTGVGEGLASSNSNSSSSRELNGSIEGCETMMNTATETELGCETMKMQPRRLPSGYKWR